MSAVLNLEVPQDVLESARLSAADLKTELAVALYAQQRLSIGKARACLCGSSVNCWRRGGLRRTMMKAIWLRMSRLCVN